MTYAVEEIAQHLTPAWGVHDLRVELDPKDPIAIRERGHRRVAARCKGMEARRHLGHGVAMAHPDRQLDVEPFEQRARLADGEQRGTVFVGAAGIDLAAQMVGDELHPVADASTGMPERSASGST